MGEMDKGKHVIKSEGGKKTLVIDYRNSKTGADIAEYADCMEQVLSLLRTNDADLVVLADLYERVYDEKQTKMLKEIADLANLFETENLWGYTYLGNVKTESEVTLSERHNLVVKIAHDLLLRDPIKAYLTLLDTLKKEKMRANAGGKTYPVVFLKTLVFVKNKLEATNLISVTKNLILRLHKVPTGRGFYHSFFDAQIKPSFVGSRLLFKTDEKVELVDQYNVLDAEVRVYRHPEKIALMYYINPPEYSLSPEKYFILTKTKEVVAKYRPTNTEFSDASQSRKYFEHIYQATINDIAKENSISISPREKEALAKIVARYTIGYGVLELLLSDRKLTDVYLDAPLGTKPIYVVHGEYGQCQTNVIFTNEEARSTVSRLRALSGRPFDEAHPVMDFNLSSLQTRVAVIGQPLSPHGIAFALRLHKTTPWTLPQFIDAHMIDHHTAGLLSFLVDSKASMLITGSRGSGKSSMLTALMLEILQNLRIIVQEDTLEIPAPYLKSIGYNIQQLKTQSAISVGRTENEVSPDEALRTALRLGDSVLIVGEVRSKEARVLYEAMRIGAVGNVVMGTIHGESAYSVWDRIVNDLEVPNTSFKATDMVLVQAPVRFKGSLKRHRRVIQLTEVKKHWQNDPAAEEGLLDLLSFDASKDGWDLLKDNFKDSEYFPKLKRTTGMSIEEIWKDIKLRGESKKYLVDSKNKFEIPALLEAENTVPMNNKLLLMAEEMRKSGGGMDYDKLLESWKKWVDNRYVKEIIAKKRLVSTRKIKR
ncbi:MAG: type II/IV secretion system ATPase subunit [Candidatus Diapherotrites archaeon]|nr:type II/IV secretion system ATPase subunit [Candidatus Diapherotrites archaeon]